MGTGLDKIIASINKQSKEACDKIISEAKKREDEILSKAKEEALEESKSIINSAMNKAKISKAAIISKAHNDVKKQALVKKQSVLDKATIEAKNLLLNCEADTYFKNIYILIGKYAENSNGEIILNKKDKDRLPSDFNANIMKYNLTLSQENANINGGFILNYGGVLENCSFDALFRTHKEDINDKIYDILF